MKDYNDLYSEVEVLILADVSEQFQKINQECYRFGQCHYFSRPKLSWSARVKMSEIKLYLVMYIDMYQFIEKGMK